MNNFWYKKKVLITGGNGFIGSKVVDEVIKRGANVTVQISGRKQKDKPDSYLGKVEVMEGDLLNANFCRIITKDKDLLLNFAAMDGGGLYKKNHSAEILRTNTQITINLLESARINKLSKILLLSSVVVYPLLSSLGGKELSNTEKWGYDGYPWSKLFLEVAAATFRSQYGMNVVVIRPGNVYGPGDHIDKGRVIPTFIMQAFNNKPINVWGDGEQEMTLISVWDFAKAVIMVAENYNDGAPLDIGGNETVTVRELANKIIKLIGSKSAITNLGPDPSNKSETVDFRKAEKLLGIKQTYSLDKGLEETVEYLKLFRQ